MAKSYWFVGATYDRSDDQTARFLTEGIWEYRYDSSYDDRYAELVNAMQPGEQIAIKSTFTQKNNLPFDSKGRSVSVMAIKAIGTITANMGDGQRVKVDWQEINPPRLWCFYTNRRSIWRVDPTGWQSQGLVDFAFSGKPQDIDRFLKHPFWGVRYGDHAEADRFAWTEFYEAFAKNLLAFRDDRTRLVDGLRDVATRRSFVSYLTRDQDPANNWVPLQDICPFTFMASFNRGLTDEKRALVAYELGEIIGVDEVAPTSFESIPLVNNQQSWFFSYAFNRAPGDIDKLWRIFVAALTLADDDSSANRAEFVNAYDDAMTVRGTSWKLTQGLYWISPWRYVTLDSKSRLYIEKELGIPIPTRRQSDPCDGETYLKLVSQLEDKFADENFPLHDFPSLSLAAFEYVPDGDESIGVASSEDAQSNKPVATGRNKIFYGPPGTGKTHAALRMLKDDYGYHSDDTSVTSPEAERFTLVTFHQSYGYEEFVEGLRPVLVDTDGTSDVQYEIRDGAFKQLCARARMAPDQRFAIVIDEINRGNISKIFGELITLIEADKRGGPPNGVEVTLPYSGEKFSVPANVDIIGTMNTADRSLAVLDTALRRRFDFEEVRPDARDEGEAPLAELRVTVDGEQINIPRMLHAMNRRIEVLYDREHCIGHSYFMGLKDVADGPERFAKLKQLFHDKILPLLDEYFFEDRQKIRLVLADNQKPHESQFIQEITDRDGDLLTLFGVDHELDGYTIKPRFVTNAKDPTPQAFSGIYTSLDS